MYIGLRIILALLYLSLGILILAFPSESCAYISVRYDGLQRLVNSFNSIQIPHKLPVLANPFWNYIFFLIMLFAAFAIVFKIRILIMIYAFLTVLIGGTLHLPYNNLELKDMSISQIRKLVWVIAIFSSLTILASAPSKNEFYYYQRIASPSAVYVSSSKKDAKDLIKNDAKHKGD